MKKNPSGSGLTIISLMDMASLWRIVLQEKYEPIGGIQIVTANYIPGGYKEHDESASGGYKKNPKLIFVFGMY